MKRNKVTESFYSEYIGQNHKAFPVDGNDIEKINCSLL